MYKTACDRYCTITFTVRNVENKRRCVHFTQQCYLLGYSDTAVVPPTLAGNGTRVLSSTYMRTYSLPTYGYSVTVLYFILTTDEYTRCVPTLKIMPSFLWR